MSDPRVEAEHLAEANRHIAEGEARVASQCALIAELSAHGHNTTQAEAFLQTLLETLVLMRQHQQQILAQLGVEDA